MKLIKSIYNRFLKLFKSISQKEDIKTKTQSSLERAPEVTPVKKRRGRPPKKK
jgi:hypothetical protein